MQQGAGNGAAAHAPAARVNDLAERAAELLGIQQVPWQVFGGAEPDGAHRAVLIAVGGHDDERREGAFAPELSQPLRALAVLLPRLAEPGAQQCGVVVSRRDGVEVLHELPQVQAGRIGLRPQGLQVMSQPLALLPVISGDQDPWRQTRSRCGPRPVAGHSTISGAVQSRRPGHSVKQVESRRRDL